MPPSEARGPTLNATPSEQLACLIHEEFEESVAVKVATLRQCAGAVRQIAMVIIDALRAGNKVLLFGNGGSAADAQHIAAELIGRYQIDRRPLPAIALTTDTSILTAVGNDYGFDQIFARQISALGNPHDVALAISTSGKSSNVIAGLQAAEKVGMKTVGFTGGDGGAVKNLAEHCLCVPSTKTARIQEVHLMAGHAISLAIERALFGQAQGPTR